MSNITELRRHLFAALDGLSDKKNPMEIERARAIADVGQVVINSVKVEVDFMRKTGERGTGFIPLEEAPPVGEKKQTQTGVKEIAHVPGGTVTHHRMRG